ncbi:MAG TPA: response regulator transcription factor [Bryobacteraceae bacterium]|jgi:two-component system KDP operon response regulator KdpE|nr:response regulator transcription factor [Bryobacteraceae bacterium]
MKPPRVLLLFEEDDNCELFRALILGEGCEVDEAAFETQTTAPLEGYCLVLFDIQRPTVRFLDLLRTWRDLVPDTTLIVVGSRTAQANRIAVLETGVDAYLTKPVVVAELRARVRAVLRRIRSQGSRPRLLSFGAGTIDLDARIVRVVDQTVRLTPTECGILEYLASHANQTVPCDELVKTLWGSDPQKGVHSLRLFIRKLRQKLEPDPTHPQYLVTDPTVGYRLQVPAEALISR